MKLACVTPLRYVALRALRYVDEVMDLLSMLTRMLDGQSLEISPNKWHSLCTPPVCRSTRPNDLTNNKQNYQTSHRTANTRAVPYSCLHPLPPPRAPVNSVTKTDPPQSPYFLFDSGPSYTSFYLKYMLFSLSL